MAPHRTNALTLTLALACAFAASFAGAQDFEFSQMKPVPPHGQPWVETAEPLPSAGVAGKAAGGLPPKLVGKAAVKDAAGRFGGGLVVDGTSYAEGSADFPGMVAREGGFTIDFWFCAAGTKATGPQTLFTIASKQGELLISLRLDDGDTIVVAIDGKDRVTAACPATADGWHHVALVVDVPRGHPDHAALALTVDGIITAAKKPDHMTPIPWM